MTQQEAMELIDDKWQSWDVPKNHPFWKLGWFRGEDEGDLDVEEFPPVQDFLSKCLARSLAPAVDPPSASAANPPTPRQDRGVKRGPSEADLSAEGLDPPIKRRPTEADSFAEGLARKRAASQRT